ncbi:MAG: aldehyde dehydrogenase family protein, partial [Flavobacteriales bacterium]|nr:aldehyde dehydrogenase family protein [Flavobacteriales bacterium]
TVEQLLAQKFDKIFFTGSADKGKLLLQAAAKHLTPVTLELGGKNPLIIAKDFNPKLIKRIVWGKFLNAGQTCLAPDYALVHKDTVYSFLASLDQCITQFYGNYPVESNSLAKIINQNHFERLKKIIDNNTNKLVFGGSYNESALKIAPTVLKFYIDEFTINDEIFGPILPIIIYENEEDINKFVNQYSNPLVYYIFSNNKSLINKLSSEITCGAVSINECLMHGGNPNLPFGGVGTSGMGKYHGYHSLLCFSNQKTIFKKSSWGNISFKFPPYNVNKLKWIKKFI